MYVHVYMLIHAYVQIFIDTYGSCRGIVGTPRGMGPYDRALQRAHDGAYQRRALE